MPKRIRPLGYDENGYSNVCKACMARQVVDESIVTLDRNLLHVCRDLESLIKASPAPLAVRVRKHAGYLLRREQIFEALNTLLGAFYDVWADLEEMGEHDRKSVNAYRKARLRGAAAKLAKDPSQLAKAAAIKLWPEAKRTGLTALQLHRRMVELGHSVSPDTVRKWVTKLRKSGTC